MPSFPEQDWNGPVLKVELTPDEVDVLEALLDRLDKLVQVEAIFDDVAFRSPFILGKDMPHVTQEGRDLIQAIIGPWAPEHTVGMTFFDHAPEDDETDTAA